jgi:hypothetical protein
VDSIEVLADKGYFHTEDFIKYSKESIIPYVAKPTYSNSIGDTIYFSDKFKYLKDENLYICPEGQKLYCNTKKINAKQKKYCNYDACGACKNKLKCTSSSTGRTITRKKTEDFVKNINIVLKKVKLNICYVKLL